MWGVYWDINRDKLSFNYGGLRGAHDIPTPWHLSLYPAVNEVADLMRGDREVLPAGNGVLYRHHGKLVLWAFREQEFNAGPRAKVRDVLADQNVATGPFTAQARRVYVISGVNDRKRS